MRSWKIAVAAARVAYTLRNERPPLTAIFEPGEDGWIMATCPELGVVSQGETMDHAEAMIKEGVECADEARRLAEPKIAGGPLEVSHA